jgi:hypothetical protein
MIAGEDGECFLGTPELAALAMMSIGKTVECRKRLIELGLLEGEITRDNGYPQAVWHIRVPDLWATNLKWREANHSLLDRVERKAAKRVHQVKATLHQVNAEGSPGEPKKNHIKKNQKEDAPLPPAQFLPGTELNEQGAPVVHIDGDDQEYECPWPLCAETILVPGSNVAGGYVCPVCKEPVEIQRNGVLFRKAKRPRKKREDLLNLGNLFPNDIPDSLADIPYRSDNRAELERFFARGTLGKFAYLDALEYLKQQGVPRRALIAAKKKMTSKSSKGVAHEPTEERGESADDIQDERCVQGISGAGSKYLD